MILLVDSGNSRIKWRLVNDVDVIAEGAGPPDSQELFSGIGSRGGVISRVAVSSVGSEHSCRKLEQTLLARAWAPVTFYWAERARAGLVNSYADVGRMGADRWHGMLGGWMRARQGFVMVDAGSAVTVDYVDSSGRHIGGYIVPGLQMMRRSLKLDAARIGFDDDDQLNVTPGNSTSACTNHGLAWMTQAMIRRIKEDAHTLGLPVVLVTGGDADRWKALGLDAEHCPGLVLDGLAAVAEAGVNA